MARASDGTPITPVVDANATGQAAIAWTTPTAVRVATSDRAGGSAMTTTLATTTAATRPAVAIDDAGEVVVVWETYRLTQSVPCHGCGGGSVASDGVFAAVGRVGTAFGAPVRLAGPRPDPPSGTDDQLTRPLLAMDPQGRAIVAGSDGANAWVASRAPGGAFDAPQRAATDFVVTGAAFGHDGEVLLTDLRSRVITRPAGGAFSAPVPLPGASTPYGPGAAIAASSAGDAVALYSGGPGPVLASRRAADGSFAAPTPLTTVNGASGRAVTVAADGTAVAVFGQIDRDPREGGHSALIAATLRPDGTSTTTQLNAPDTDGDILRGGLDGDDAGHVAFAYTQSTAALFPGKAFATLQQPDGSRLGPAMLGSAPFGLGDLAKVAVSGATVLATWTEHTGGTVHLLSRWLPGGETVTLDHTADPYSGLAKLFGTPKSPAKLSVRRATVHRTGRSLDVLAPIAARASGRVAVEFYAAGRHTPFTVAINPNGHYVRFNHKIPKSQADMGTGILTLTYPGDTDTQPQTVRLRAAANKANLKAGRPQIKNGHLTASGTLNPKAKGVVRIRVPYHLPGQPGITRVLQYKAPIKDGAYTLDVKLSDTIQTAIKARAGTVHSYTLFTGYLPKRIRGEMASYQILGPP